MNRILNKSFAVTITLLMLSSMILSLAIPYAGADGTMATYAYIGVTPNPVGVGQEVLLHIGITQQLTNVAMGWEGLSVTITKPDGTIETIGGIKTDSTGGTGRVYTPSTTGNYTFQTHFPAQNTTSTKVAGSTPVGTYMLASDSDIVTLVVNDAALIYNPGYPLPTEYWTRPINAQLREWYTISGSWLAAGSTIGAEAPYNQAPESPHVLWTKPLTMGGLVGGELGLVGSGATSVAFSNGDAYQGLWSSRLIVAGVLIYAWHTGARPLVYTAVNLRTGEEMWKTTFLDNRTISTGQIFYWQSYNSQGSWPYLWVVVGSDWYAFSPYDAALRFVITNVPSGTNVFGERGDLYRYTVNTNAGWMALWNMSALISMAGGWGPNNYPGPNTVYNASAVGSNGQPTAAAARAWAFNVTIPKGLPGSAREFVLGDKVVGSSLNNTDVVTWALSLKPGQEGQLLYNTDWKAPSAWSEGNQTLSWGATSIKNNLAVVWSKEERRHYGFSLETGQYLWVTDPEHYLDIYDAGRSIYEGKVISVGQAGIVYAYDGKTGKTLWTYAGDDPYREVLWSDNWPVDQYFPCEGKIYFFQQEHSANQPLPRGAAAYCLNATTGEVIWRTDGLVRDNHWGSEAIMGDSVIAIANTYDQQIYTLGKGPSAITVEAPDIGVQLGTSVTIKGTVTDVSPGTKQTSVTLRFPYGVPAVSDESQGDWMKYVYVQLPRPANTTGVDVTLFALDSNGNYREIGKTTSDASGLYSFNWKPDIEGKYIVYAVFAGSKSYYPSFAESAFTVDTAAATASPYPEVIVPDTQMTVITMGSLIIVAIAIGFAITILMLKKRPLNQP